MKVYKFCILSEWLVQNVFRKHLYLNAPSNFNDPTENNFEIENIDGPEGVNNLLSKNLKKNLIKSLFEQGMLSSENFSSNDYDSFGVNLYNKNYSISKGVKEGVFEGLNSDSVVKFCHKLIKDTQVKFGISCFTTNINNPLMWGHYADGMRGVCFEYEIDEVELKKVNYTKPYRVNISSVLSGNAEPEVVNTFLCKNEDWSYEEEYRLIGKKKFYKLSSEQLRGVYFGYKCDPDKAQFLTDLIIKSFGNHVKFYVSRNSTATYDIISEPMHDRVVDDYIKSLSYHVGGYEVLLDDRNWAELYRKLGE